MLAKETFTQQNDFFLTEDKWGGIVRKTKSKYINILRKIISLMFYIELVSVIKIMTVIFYRTVLGKIKERYMKFQMKRG
jgi:hypothetical protein